MSIGGGTEVQRAVANITAPNSVITEDITRFLATEDREIVGIWFSTDQSTSVELSFSSAEFSLSAPGGSAPTADVNDARSPVVYAAMDIGINAMTTVDPIHWDEGAELHVHVEENTATDSAVVVVVYYREV